MSASCSPAMWASSGSLLIWDSPSPRGWPCLKTVWEGSGDNFSYLTGVSAAGCGVSNPRDLWGAPAVFLRFAGGRWAHPWTRLDEVRGNPHLGTRVCVRAVARGTSTVRKSAEGLSNNNNPEYLLNFLWIMLTGQMLILCWKWLWIYTFNKNKRF